MAYYCTECGATVSLDQHYCHVCGVEFNDTVEMDGETHSAAELRRSGPPSTPDTSDPQEESEATLEEIVGLLILIPLLMFAAADLLGYTTFDPEFPWNYGPESADFEATGTFSLLYASQDALDDADIALQEGNWSSTERHLDASEARLKQAQQRLEDERSTLDPAVASGLEGGIQATARMQQALASELEWHRTIDAQTSRFGNATDERTKTDALQALELTLATTWTLVDRYETAHEITQAFRQNQPELASSLRLESRFGQSYADLADDLRALHHQYSQAVEMAQTELGDKYTPPEDRELRLAETRAELGGHVPERLRTFFESFDRNGNNRLDAAEASTFFYWVEDNVPYRYDDEDATPRYSGVPVGDGRPGSHYQQTPIETYEERLGDCEDMNTLQVAFYNYWGIAAYQGLVNAETQEGTDHAVAIVYAGTVEQAHQTFSQGLHYYTFEDDNEWGIPGGAYVIVDNAYSDSFGYISGGIDQGQFRLQEIRSLGETLSEPVA